MEVRWELMLIIVGGAVVTMIPRVFPLVVLSKMKLPEWSMRWLHYIPIAIMAALLSQELLLTAADSGFIRLWAALPTVLVAVLTRSLMGTVAVGILSMMLLRYFF
ncbi:AzlD domain-containing protein [Paenibacillus apiarius]|uniref:AzlD domain-containing protein n=1 Tax=Paenibacillus apiarius TaxID=46240 RepID=UPI003B3B346E